MGNSFTVFFKERQKNIVNQKEAIVGLPDDGGNFVGMEAKVQGMQNTAGARYAEKGFQVAGMIPHQGATRSPGRKPSLVNAAARRRARR